LFGASRGSELALLASAFWPGRFTGTSVASPSGVAIVGYGPSGATGTAACTFSGEPLLGEIQVERIRDPILFLVPGGDQLWPSTDLTAPALERRPASPDPSDLHRSITAHDADREHVIWQLCARRPGPGGCAARPATSAVRRGTAGSVRIGAARQ
jgi:hypothetical protein